MPFYGYFCDDCAQLLTDVEPLDTPDALGHRCVGCDEIIEGPDSGEALKAKLAHAERQLEIVRGANSILARDNITLRRDNDELRDENKRLRNDNTNLFMRAVRSDSMKGASDPGDECDSDEEPHPCHGCSLPFPCCGGAPTPDPDWGV